MAPGFLALGIRLKRPILPKRYIHSLRFFLDGISPRKDPTTFFLEGTAVEALDAYCERGIPESLTQLLAWYGRSSVVMCRPQERARNRGACQTFAGDAGKSLSGMAGGAPTTSAGVATRASQERRSPSRSNLASRRLWRSRQARAMIPSWTCSSSMRAQSLCPLIVRQVSSPAASSGCSLPGSPLPSRSRAGGPAAASACSHLGLVLADSPARHGFCSLSLAETEKPRQDALGCGGGEATGAFSERETHGHPPPSHHLKHHSGPVPLTVGKGRPPLEHEGAQVEAPQACSADPPGPVAVRRGRSRCL